MKNKNKPETKEREKSKMKNLSLFLVGLMACVAIGVSTARAQVAYSLEDLGVVKGMQYSEPAALNNLGSAVGTAYGGEETCAFHYDFLKKFMYDAGGANSRAFGISSTSMIVGDTFFPGPMEPRSHAAIFKAGTAIDLGVMKGKVYSRANAVNAMGQVVGFSGLTRDSAESNAFMWSGPTGFIDLGTLGGSYAQAYAINDAGFITGTAETQAIVPTTHAFIREPQRATSGPMRDLGVLGGHSSYGMAINAYNHVAGYSTVKANLDRFHAFFHDGKTMIDLGSLGGRGTDTDVSVALGINKLDQVVGYTFLPTVGGMPLQQVAFLWRKGGIGNGLGQMVNLNKLLYGTGKDYLLTSAVAINDNGQILASAYNLRNGGIHAVLLTPEGPVNH